MLLSIGSRRPDAARAVLFLRSSRATWSDFLRLSGWLGRPGDGDTLPVAGRPRSAAAGARSPPRKVRPRSRAAVYVWA